MPTFTLDRGAIAAALDAAPASLEPGDRPVRVTLPAPNGGFERFEVAETTVMAPKLARLHPEIRTYAGVGVDEPRAGVRITLSPLGLQASVRGGRFGAWYVDPVYRRDTSLYGSYVGADLINRHGPLIEPGGDRSPRGTRRPAEGADQQRLATADLPAGAAHRPVLRDVLRSGECHRRQGGPDQPG